MKNCVTAYVHKQSARRIEKVRITLGGGKLDTIQANDANEYLAAHEDVVSRVLESQPNENYLYELAELFKVFGDPTRIRILSLLAHEEMCVTCIADSLGMTHSAISHQLRLLRATNLVKFTKDGKEVIYSLDDSHVLSLFDQALDHVKHKVL